MNEDSYSRDGQLHGQHAASSKIATAPLNDSYMPTARIMVVDDEPTNLKILDKGLLLHGYKNVELVEDPRKVIELYKREKPDLILLDLNMPYLSGFEVMDELNALQDPLMPPVIVLTAQGRGEYLVKAFQKGVRDYLTKPINITELVARVGNMLKVHTAHIMMYQQKDLLDRLVRERTAELLETRLQVVRKLGRAAEYRDNETGKHIVRVSSMAALMAKELGFGKEESENILHAAPMHDIGKIGIPDKVLLKPGKLDEEEWTIMKQHTTIGGHILEGDDSDLLRLAREIALTHHERWDGTGYPRGLQGEDIPLSGRIVSLADVFDALTSVRPYKKAWKVEEAVAFIQENRGSQFDPNLVDLFEKLLPENLQIRNRFMDEDN